MTETECYHCEGTGWNGYDKVTKKMKACECQNARRIRILLENPEILGLTNVDIKRFTFRNFKPTKQTAGVGQSQARVMAKHYKDWVANKFNFLTISGSTGFGKTHLAKAAVVELVKKGSRPYYSRAVELNRQLRNFEDGEADRYRDQLTNAPYLVLDDVGVEHDPRGYLQSIYHGVIDDRYSYERPTLVITNLSLDSHAKISLARAIGVRSVSRLSSGKMLAVRGKDLRGVN